MCCQEDIYYIYCNICYSAIRILSRKSLESNQYVVKCILILKKSILSPFCVWMISLLKAEIGRL